MSRVAPRREGWDDDREAERVGHGPKLGYGTLEGVFTPTLLTILGVIMYLREGWVVGNAGLGGAWLVILVAFAITGATAASLASVATNVRIGAGGAFSVISQSLGLEAGGSIGIPLYVAQALAVALYVFGFRTGWLYVFPDHPALAVDLVAFVVLFVIAFIGPTLAFRVQYGILAIVVASLVSIAVSAATGALTEPVQWFGSYPGAPETGFEGTTFWAVFAVFFPAATGILAGANLSGELRDPRRSLPVGTLSAIAVALVIYLALAWWLARVASPAELVRNYTVMIDRAFWGPVVLAGLLGATFSSALSSLVGAPRILQAIAEHGVVPGSRVLARVTRGEPRNAVGLTGLIVIAGLMLRDLNAIAPLITMFFLITYTTVNGVVLVEQGLGLASFRPHFRLPLVVPLVGAIGCLVAMFVVNALVGLLAVVLVGAFYVVLVRRRLRSPFDDVRSGLFRAVAEWAAKRITLLRPSERRTWKPNVLLPVTVPEGARGAAAFLEALTYPRGSVQCVALPDGWSGRDRLADELNGLVEGLRRHGVHATWTTVEDEPAGRGTVVVMQALQGSLFAPNAVFLRLPLERAVAGDLSDDDLRRIIEETERSSLGALLLAEHPRAGLGRHSRVTLWVDDQSPHWELSMDLYNLDLPVLLAYTLARNWGAALDLRMAVRDPDQEDRARSYLEQLVAAARLPSGCGVHVVARPLAEAARGAPPCDLAVFSLEQHPRLDDLRALVDELGTSCLFVRDSGQESALA